MNPSLLLRLVSQRNFWLVELRTWLFKRDLRILVDKERTHLCIEGYPRSANSFCTRLFWLANPEERNHVAHHTHAIGSIARALRFRIPVILLVRNPVDAIVSACMYKGTEFLDYYVRHYIAFHKWLIQRKSQVVVAEFGLATTNFNEIIDRVNKKYGVAFNRVVDLKETQEKLLSYLKSPEFQAKKKKQRLGRKGFMPVSTLSSEDAAKKEDIRSIILRHKRIGDAQALYEKMLS
jgi:hypothetical protein